MYSVNSKLTFLILVFVSLMNPVFAQKKDPGALSYTNNPPLSSDTKLSSKKPSISQTEIEHLIGDVTKAYESRDLQRFMSYVPLNTIGRDRLQDAIRKDFETLFDIRLSRQDENLVLSEDKAIYEALWRRKAFLNEAGRMTSISDERRAQMFLIRGLDGKIQIDMNHSPTAGGAVGGFPFVSSYDTSGTGALRSSGSAEALILTVNTSVSPATFFITVRDANARTSSVVVNYTNGHGDIERFTISLTSPGVYSRNISVTLAGSAVTTLNGVPEVDTRITASTTHTFKYSASKNNFGLGGGEKTVVVNFP